MWREERGRGGEGERIDRGEPVFIIIRTMRVMQTEATALQVWE